MASNQLARRILSLPSHLRCQALKASLATPALRVQISPRTYATYNTNFSTANSTQSSVNHEEVSHFNALASSWWDPNGSSRLLHLMNPLRHQFIRKCFSTQGAFPNEKLKFLDIGCGGGIFAESAARLSNAKSVTPA